MCIRDRRRPLCLKGHIRPEGNPEDDLLGRRAPRRGASSATGRAAARLGPNGRARDFAVRK
eukprot:10685586-Alexandrium_andersonii.AAC.1